MDGGARRSSSSASSRSPCARCARRTRRPTAIRTSSSPGTSGGGRCGTRVGRGHGERDPHPRRASARPRAGRVGRRHPRLLGAGARRARSTRCPVTRRQHLAAGGRAGHLPRHVRRVLRRAARVDAHPASSRRRPRSSRRGSATQLEPRRRRRRRRPRARGASVFRDKTCVDVPRRRRRGATGAHVAPDLTHLAAARDARRRRPRRTRPTEPRALARATPRRSSPAATCPTLQPRPTARSPISSPTSRRCDERPTASDRRRHADARTRPTDGRSSRGSRRSTTSASASSTCVTALVLLRVGGVEALLIRLQLARPNSALPLARRLQPALHHARHDDDLPRRDADAGRLRQLPRAAHDRRARHGVPAPERDELLAVPVRRRCCCTSACSPAARRRPGGSATRRSARRRSARRRAPTTGSLALLVLGIGSVGGGDQPHRDRRSPCARRG